MREALRTLAEAVALAALLALCGCSLAVRAELLNPLNKSGRTETSSPAPTPTAFPTPSPAATPTPGGAM